jgi:hypothetical protein
MSSVPTLVDLERIYQTKGRAETLNALHLRYDGAIPADQRDAVNRDPRRKPRWTEVERARALVRSRVNYVRQARSLLAWKEPVAIGMLQDAIAAYRRAQEASR